MSDTPAVSIIIATFNWSSVLRYAIESALGQTFQSFELLVIGDGCTDNSAEVAQSFHDPRIIWRNLPANSGNQSAPNNLGLQLARGKYVAYHGHDDIWHPTHLENLVRTIEANDADLAYAAAVMIGPAGSGVRIVTGMADGYTPDLFFPPSSVMHRRDVVERVGPWRDYRTITQPPDKEFIGRIMEHRRRIAGTGGLTVFKFNASWRRNSYVERPCHEQAEYLRRMRAEPDFIANELRAIKDAQANGKTYSPVNIQMPRNLASLPPGWQVEQWRAIRGLPPNELPPAPPRTSILSTIQRTMRQALASAARRFAPRSHDERHF